MLNYLGLDLHSRSVTSVVGIIRKGEPNSLFGKDNPQANEWELVRTRKGELADINRIDFSLSLLLISPRLFELLEQYSLGCFRVFPVPDSPLLQHELKGRWGILQLTESFERLIDLTKTTIVHYMKRTGDYSYYPTAVCNATNLEELLTYQRKAAKGFTLNKYEYMNRDVHLSADPGMQKYHMLSLGCWDNHIYVTDHLFDKLWQMLGEVVSRKMKIRLHGVQIR